MSSLFHFQQLYSAVFCLCLDSFDKKRLNIIFVFIFGSILIILTFFYYDSVYYKLLDYLKPGNVYNEAKSAIIIWTINFLPIAIYLKNISKFNFNESFKRVIFFFLIYEMSSFFLIFFNSLFAYRFLLYGFPISIYITSFLPDADILKIKSKYVTFSLVFLCFISLAYWLQNAYHAYCWLPYKNIILNI